MPNMDTPDVIILTVLAIAAGMVVGYVFNRLFPP